MTNVSGVVNTGTNGRMYPLPLLERVAKEYTASHIIPKKAFDTGGDGAVINLSRVGFLITRLELVDGVLQYDATILNTPMGAYYNDFLNEGATLTMSLSGTGSLKDWVVQDDYTLIGLHPTITPKI